MEAFEQLIKQIAPNLYAYRDRFFTSFQATFEMFAKAGILAFVIGMFFGVLLVITRKGGVRENIIVYQIANILINVFRSIPFIILLIFLIPLTRAVVGTAIGVKGAILPLVFGTVPFYTRQVEVALAGVDEGKVSMILYVSKDLHGRFTAPALIKEVDYNSMTRKIDEIDFQALVSDEKVSSTAEIVILNREAVIGGVLQEDLSEVAYKAFPSALVETTTLHAAGLKVGDTVHVKDLEIAKNKDIDLKTDPEAVVLSVIPVHNVVPATEVTTAPGTVAADDKETK